MQFINIYPEQLYVMGNIQGLFYINVKYYENICNWLGIIQQDRNRKLKNDKCWQRSSLKYLEEYNVILTIVTVFLLSK